MTADFHKGALWNSETQFSTCPNLKVVTWEQNDCGSLPRSPAFVNVFFLKKKFMFVSIFWERKNAHGRSRERERENPKQVFTVSAEPTTELNVTNREIMTWPEIESRILNWLNHPGAPVNVFVLRKTNNKHLFLKVIGRYAVFWKYMVSPSLIFLIILEVWYEEKIWYEFSLCPFHLLFNCLKT